MAALIGALCAAAVLAATGSASARLTPRRDPGSAVRRRGRARGSPTADLIRLLGAVASGLRAGGAPSTVWETFLGRGTGPEGVPELADLLAAVRPAGGSRISRRDTVGLATATVHAAGVLAACRVAAELGAPLAPVLDRAVRVVEAEHEAEAETAAAVAAPRQTVRLLSWLPLWGVVLGAIVGATPLAVLFDGGVGTLCLLLGGGCAMLGRTWIDRLLARARAAGGVDSDGS